MEPFNMKINILLSIFLLYILFSYVTTMLLNIIGFCMFVYIIFYLIFSIYFDCDVTLAFAERFGKSIASIKGKVVFITGASSGIGEYTALALAKNGVKLVLAARRLEELQRVKSACLESSNGQLKPDDILVLQMDVLNFDLHKKYFDRAIHHFGTIDILLNNAGRSQRANWERIDLKVDKEIFDLNVFAVINLSRIAVKYFMKENKCGHIAVTSSIVVPTCMPFSSSYVGAKHALHGYFKSLKCEKDSNKIKTTILCPGPTFTNYMPISFTENNGQVYGKCILPTDKRMSTERCGHLCAVSLANELDESWIALFPFIILSYVSVYYPSLYKILLKLLGPETLNRIRDGRKSLNKN